MKNAEGQVIQYIDGWAWGIAPSGETICLGTEPDIRAILLNPRRHPQNPTIAEVVSLERQLTGLEKPPREPIKVWRKLRKHAKKAGVTIKEQRKRERAQEGLLKFKPTPMKPVKRKEGKKEADICPVCRKRKAASPHHIKSRDDGGEDNKRNIVYLCSPCHDVVEEYKCRGKCYSPVLIELIRLEGRIPE